MESGESAVCSDSGDSSEFGYSGESGDTGESGGQDRSILVAGISKFSLKRAIRPIHSFGFQFIFWKVPKNRQCTMDRTADGSCEKRQKQGERFLSHKYLHSSLFLATAISLHMLY